MSGNKAQEGLWIQNGNPFTVNETTPFVSGQLGLVSSFPNTGSENGVATGTPIHVQYVKRYATDTVASIAGGLAFWQDMDNFVVTGEPASAVGGTTAPIPAGVFGGTLPGAGNYGFIQVGEGVGPVRLVDSTSAGTVGNLLVWNTNHQVRHLTAGTQVNQNFLPIVGVLKTLNTATGTNLSCEAVLTIPRHGW